MSRLQASKHYARILTQWPVDRLRPELTFQKVLQKRIDAAPAPQINDANTAQVEVLKKRNTPQAELKEINALYSLLENRYSTTYPTSNHMMHPVSAPDHYTRLAKELDELPTRSTWQRIVHRFKGMVRLS